VPKLKQLMIIPPETSESIGIPSEQNGRWAAREYTLSTRILVGGQPIHNIAAVIKNVLLEKRKVIRVWIVSRLTMDERTAINAISQRPDITNAIVEAGADLSSNTNNGSNKEECERFSVHDSRVEE